MTSGQAATVNSFSLTTNRQKLAKSVILSRLPSIRKWRRKEPCLGRRWENQNSRSELSRPKLLQLSNRLLVKRMMLDLLRSKREIGQSHKSKASKTGILDTKETNTQKISADIPNTFFYNIAVSYDMTDKLNLSSSVFYSEKFSNPMLVTAIGVDYNVTPGLKPYAKITHFNIGMETTYHDCPTR